MADFAHAKSNLVHHIYSVLREERVYLLHNTKHIQNQSKCKQQWQATR